MRRMKYNPLEKPFASGEINNSSTPHFVLDKVLTVGFYVITIYDYGNDTYLTTLLNISSYGEAIYSNSSLVYSPALVSPMYLQFSNERPDNKLYIYFTEGDHSLLEGSTISVYKLN